MSRTWGFHSAGQIVFGCGAVEELGHRLSRLSALDRPSGGSPRASEASSSVGEPRRVLIVTDPALVRAGLLERVDHTLRESRHATSAFTAGEPEPSLAIAEACAKFGRAFRPDVVLGLGGGSNMDLAKIAAVLLTHGGSPRDYLGENRVPGPVLPLVCVPTTAGTGSEVTHCGVLTDQENQLKVSTLSNLLRPALAVVDPTMMISCPRKVTADSGIDALSHAIEAYTAVPNDDYPVPTTELSVYQGCNPLGDLFAERAIRLIAEHLVNAVEQPTNLVAREGMALAATLAGLAFSNVGVALVHALEYPIGGATHCSHGEGNGLLLPHVMRYNLPARPERFARIAELLGEDIADIGPHAAGERAIAAVARLASAIGIRPRLRDLGAREDQLPLFAAKAFAIKRLMRVNPRQPNENDLARILQAAW